MAITGGIDQKGNRVEGSSGVTSLTDVESGQVVPTTNIGGIGPDGNFVEDAGTSTTDVGTNANLNTNFTSIYGRYRVGVSPKGNLTTSIRGNDVANGVFKVKSDSTTSTTNVSDTGTTGNVTSGTTSSTTTTDPTSTGGTTGNVDAGGGVGIGSDISPTVFSRIRVVSDTGTKLNLNGETSTGIPDGSADFSDSATFDITGLQLDTVDSTVNVNGFNNPRNDIPVGRYRTYTEVKSNDRNFQVDAFGSDYDPVPSFPGFGITPAGTLLSKSSVQSTFRDGTSVSSDVRALGGADTIPEIHVGGPPAKIGSIYNDQGQYDSTIANRLGPVNGFGENADDGYVGIYDSSGNFIPTNQLTSPIISSITQSSQVVPFVDTTTRSLAQNYNGIATVSPSYIPTDRTITGAIGDFATDIIRGLGQQVSTTVNQQINGALSTVFGKGQQGKLNDYDHASKFFRSNNYKFAPKHAFLFHVYFDINPTVVSPSTFELSMLAKQVSLPRMSVDTKAVNSYNATKIIQTKMRFEPINIIFHDDCADTVRNFWNGYMGHYWSEVNSKPGYGGFSAPAKRYLNKIHIYSLHNKKFSTVTLINPIIKSYAGSEHNMTAHTELMSVTMSIEYEGVVYNDPTLLNLLGMAQSPYYNNFVAGQNTFSPNPFLPKSTSTTTTPAVNSATTGTTAFSAFDNSISNSNGNSFVTIPRIVGGADSLPTLFNNAFSPTTDLTNIASPMPSEQSSGTTVATTKSLTGSALSTYTATFTESEPDFGVTVSDFKFTDNKFNVNDLARYTGLTAAEAQQMMNDLPDSTTLAQLQLVESDNVSSILASYSLPPTSTDRYQYATTGKSNVTSIPNLNTDILAEIDRTNEQISNDVKTQFSQTSRTTGYIPTTNLTGSLTNTGGAVSTQDSIVTNLDKRDQFMYA